MLDKIKKYFTPMQEREIEEKEVQAEFKPLHTTAEYEERDRVMQETYRKLFKRPIAEMSEGEVCYWIAEIQQRTYLTKRTDLEQELSERRYKIERDKLEAQWAKERGE